MDYYVLLSQMTYWKKIYRTSKGAKKQQAYRVMCSYLMRAQWAAQRKGV